ncbi:unnamed protein product, partial [Ectocarpus sp. 4 AP-2014]
MAGLLMHGALSFLSGLSVAITGFDCDSAREILTELAPDSSAFDASSAINMGFSAGLVTAVQAVLLRRLINGALLLNTLPLTFIGVVLSLNVFSVSVLAALVPALGACLFGLSLAKLWMELADCRHETSVREPDDDCESSRSWKWTGERSVGGEPYGRAALRELPPSRPGFHGSAPGRGSRRQRRRAGRWGRGVEGHGSASNMQRVAAASRPPSVGERSRRGAAARGVGAGLGRSRRPRDRQPLPAPAVPPPLGNHREQQRLRQLRRGCIPVARHAPSGGPPARRPRRRARLLRRHGRGRAPGGPGGGVPAGGRRGARRDAARRLVRRAVG